MSSVDHTTLDNSLDRIGRGDATPAEASAAIRKALTAEPSLAERAYDVLRNVTWRMLTSRSFGDDLPGWSEVVEHAAALAESKNAGGIAERIRACADLIAQSARFAQLQPLDEVLKRKHTKSLLMAVGSAGKSITNVALMSTLGLRESNLSRLTGALQGTGLLARSKSGKEASFELTDLGRRIAKKLDIAVKEPGVDTEWWQEAPFPVAVWGATGEPVGANAAFYRLTRAHEPHALPSLGVWKLYMGKTALDHRMASKDVWRLQIDETTWIQFTETAMPDGGTCLLGSDVSSTMKAINDVKEALKVAQEAEARARREFADTANRLVAYQSANSHIRNEIMTVAARSNERVRDVVHAAQSQQRVVPSALLAIEKDLGAMQVAVRDLMGPIFIMGHRGESPMGWIDPNQIVAEAMSTAKDLHPTTRATASFGNVPKVRGAVDTLRTVLSHMVIIGTRHGAYDFHGALKGSNLVTTVRVKAPELHNPYLDAFEAEATSGLGYCRAIVETSGGIFEMQDTGPDSDPMFVFSLPVEGTTSRGRAVKFGIPAKVTKSRKPTSGSHR
jgi:predicted transcriptional regulator